MWELDAYDIGSEPKLSRKELIRRIRRIEIATGRVVEETLAGQYHSAFKGRGMEFDRVRPYEAGDDIRDIDWNVTARAGETYVKQYQEERELTVLLAVDVSRSMQFGTHPRSKRQLAAELAALMAFSAIWNNDKVGLVLFTDRVEKLIVPKKGRKHALRVVSDVLKHEPVFPGSDLERALKFIAGLRIRRSVVFLVSDFAGQVPEKALSLVQRRHDLVPVVVRDRAETRVENWGLTPLRDLETGQVVWADTSSREVREALEKARNDYETRLEQAFKKVKAFPVQVACDEEYTSKLAAFFRRRALRR